MIIIILMIFESSFWHLLLRVPWSQNTLDCKDGAESPASLGLLQTELIVRMKALEPTNTDPISPLYISKHVYWTSAFQALDLLHLTLGVSPDEYDSARKHYSLLHYLAARRLRSWGHLGALVKQQKFPFASGKYRWVDSQRHQKTYMGAVPKADSCKFGK